MIKNVSNSNPTFHGKFILSSFAGTRLNERFKKMPNTLRAKALAEYDTFITKVMNSDYNIHIFQINKKDLCASISLEGEKYPIAYAEDKYNLLAKLGLKNPVKFMQKAFEKAQKISE